MERTDPTAGRAERSIRRSVVVVGGGPAGTAAALAAAREGADVLLIEKLSFLGGTSTAALVGPWMAFLAGGRRIVGGIAQEIVERLAAWGGCPGHLPDPLGVCGSITPFDTELLKLLLFEMTAEAGVTLALHTVVTGVTSGGGALESVEAHDRTGRLVVEGAVFVDASGDADVASLAGVRFEVGRPTDGLTQPLTAVYKVGGVDTAELKAYVKAHPDEFVLGGPADEFDRLPCFAISGFFSQVREARATGELTIPRDRVLLFGLPRPGEVSVNMTRIQGLRGHVAEELTRAEVEGARQIRESFEFLRRRIPGFSRSHLLQVPSQVGIRETRRIVGRYVLTRNDVVSGARFDDSVALGGFPIDVHAPSGAGVECTQDSIRPYQIPLRCLVPSEVKNLLVTGRCLSATFEAHASVRITPTCMALGQAAGTAAAVMALRGASNDDLAIDELAWRLDRAGAIRF